MDHLPRFPALLAHSLMKVKAMSENNGSNHQSPRSHTPKELIDVANRTLITLRELRKDLDIRDESSVNTKEGRERCEAATDRIHATLDLLDECLTALFQWGRSAGVPHIPSEEDCRSFLNMETSDLLPSHTCSHYELVVQNIHSELVIEHTKQQMGVSRAQAPRLVAIGDLLVELVRIDDGVLSLGSGLARLRQDDPYGVVSDPLENVALSCEIVREIQNRITAWVDPLQKNVKSAREKCSGIAHHLASLVDDPIKWETDLRTNLRLLGDALAGLTLSLGSENDERMVIAVASQIYAQGTRLQDARDTVEALPQMELVRHASDTTTQNPERLPHIRQLAKFHEQLMGAWLSLYSYKTRRFEDTLGWEYEDLDPDTPECAEAVAARFEVPFLAADAGDDGCWGWLDCWQRDELTIRDLNAYRLISNCGGMLRESADKLGLLAPPEKETHNKQFVLPPWSLGVTRINGKLHACVAIPDAPPLHDRTQIFRVGPLRRDEFYDDALEAAAILARNLAVWADAVRAIACSEAKAGGWGTPDLLESKDWPVFPGDDQPEVPAAAAPAPEQHNGQTKTSITDTSGWLTVKLASIEAQVADGTITKWCNKTPSLFTVEGRGPDRRIEPETFRAYLKVWSKQRRENASWR